MIKSNVELAKELEKEMNVPFEYALEAFDQCRTPEEEEEITQETVNEWKEAIALDYICRLEENEAFEEEF